MAVVPNDFTACEEYKGVTIALRNGAYKGFRNGEPLIGFGPEATRASVRRAIDYAEKRAISLADAA